MINTGPGNLKRSPMGSTNRHLSRIDTNVTPSSDDDYLEASPLRTSPSNFSRLGLPSFRLSTSPISDGSSTYRPEPMPNNLRVRRNESRKLLSHVLHQLAHRKKPPPVKDMVWNGNNDTNTPGFGMATGTMKNFGKLMPDKRAGIQDDSDDDESRDFSTDETLDLMIQLEEVLTMSIEHGWKICDDGFGASLHHNRQLNSLQNSSSRQHGQCKTEILLDLSE